MKKLIILFSALLALLIAIPALAAPIRVFVADMSAVGAPNRDEMKITLQSLLSSRLTSENITAVGSAAEADVVVTGTYVVIGKIFSVDALAKSAAGKTLTRAFVQGDSQDELIPAMGKLADKLAAELAKITSLPAAAVPGSSRAVSAAGDTPESDIIQPRTLQKAPSGDIIKSRDSGLPPAAKGWLSKRLEGAANLIATGKSLPDGSREIFLAGNRRIAYYHQGSDMTLTSETELGDGYKIISLDTSEGSDGALDVYVTIMRGGELASQVWQVRDSKLVKVADNLPWFFRNFRLAGGDNKLYAQAMGRDADFFGDVAEASRNGSRITLSKPIKMPRYGNIYTFNQFRTAEGKLYSVVINPDGYLIVYDQDMKELWRSNDRFGGSELYFQKDDTSSNVIASGNEARWIFLNMHIQVSEHGDILVGKNDGFWVLGNARMYKKGSVFCMAWNGSSLEEKWRTRETQNYMPDYYFDDSRNELLMLQTVQRPGIFSSGASSLSIKKVE